MTRTLALTRPGLLPNGFTLDLESTDTRMRVRITDAQNQLAASGQAGLGRTQPCRTGSSPRPGTSDSVSARR